MSTAAEWIGVPLTAEQMKLAEQWGRARWRRSVRAKARGWENASHLPRNITGVRGELAVRLYLAEPIPATDDEWIDDVRRGYDVAGYSIRCRTTARYDLPFSRGDKGPFILCFDHEAPTIWLVGTISTEDAYQLAYWRNDGDNRNGREFAVVDKRFLRPLPAANGYEPQGERWLIDPQSAFWCEACDSNHAIIEHRDCRSALGRLTQQWAAKAMKYTYPPTEETGTS